jgi:hypothetical protein
MRPTMLEVSFSGILGLPTITDNVYLFPANVFTLFDYVCVFKPSFHAWGNGAFQMSAIVDEYYYQPPGGGTHSPVDFSLTFVKPTTTHGYVLHNVPFGVSTAPNYFLLPPQDAPYWLYDPDT